MNRYNLALLLLALAAVPLLYVSGWLGVATLTAIYVLLARLAIQDFERPSGRNYAVRPRLGGGGGGANSQHPAGVRPLDVSEPSSGVFGRLSQ